MLIGSEKPLWGEFNKLLYCIIVRCVLDNQQRVIQSFVESFNDFLRIFKVSKIQAQKRKW